MTPRILHTYQAIPTAREDGKSAMQKWRSAKHWILGNAVIFLLASLMVWFAGVRSLPVLLTISGCYFVGGGLGFLKLMLLGNPLNPIAWYQLGTSLFFGMGAIVGALYQDRAIYASQEQVIDDLLNANLLNATSIVLVLGTATALFEQVQIRHANTGHGGDLLGLLLLKYFDPLMYLSLTVLGVNLYFFPMPENLLVRAFAGYGSQVSQAFMLVLGYLWPRLRQGQAMGGMVCFACLVTLNIASFSKLTATLPWLFLCVGHWLRNVSARSIVIGVLGLAAYYSVLGEVVTVARDNSKYNEITSLYGRFTILQDSVDAVFIENALREYQKGSDEEQALGKYSRLSTLWIQGFLIQQYERNLPGHSLDDFWAALIPRALWSDKPVITRFGNELDALFWNRSGETSALAPSYSAEAYWNYGPAGLLIVSLVLGFEIAWLARHAHLAKLGLDPGYYLICFPGILLALNVEAWIAASYVGGFITLVVLYKIAKYFLERTAVRGVRNT